MRFAFAVFWLTIWIGLVVVAWFKLIDRLEGTDARVVVHNSMDGRELVEQHGRQLSAEDVMIQWIAHRPDFIDTDEPCAQGVAATVEALLAAPWIAVWADEPNFHQWVLSERNGSRLLMAEFDGGETWWVVAYLKSDGPIALPAWVPRAARAR